MEGRFCATVRFLQEAVFVRLLVFEFFIRVPLCDCLAASRVPRAPKSVCLSVRG